MKYQARASLPRETLESVVGEPCAPERWEATPPNLALQTSKCRSRMEQWATGVECDPGTVQSEKHPIARNTEPQREVF